MKVTTYACMLRGINVGGRTRIAMQDLRSLFVDLGHLDVVTYVQSGNVVFKSQVGRPSELVNGIEQRIASDLDIAVRVLLRTADELAEIVDTNPFLRRGADPTKLHVTFLADAPEAARLRHIDVPAAEPDEFRLHRREVYLHCPDGYGRTKLNNALWERRLGVPATTRNWNTVTKLRVLTAE